MNRIFYAAALSIGMVIALAGCGANNSGPNPVPGGPDFSHPGAADAVIRKQIAGIQASSEPDSFKRQQIAQLQGLLNHAKPVGEGAAGTH